MHKLICNSCEKLHSTSTKFNKTLILWVNRKNAFNSKTAVSGAESTGMKGSREKSLAVLLFVEWCQGSKNSFKCFWRVIKLGSSVLYLK